MRKIPTNWVLLFITAVLGVGTMFVGRTVGYYGVPKVGVLNVVVMLVAVIFTVVLFVLLDKCNGRWTKNGIGIALWVMGAFALSFIYDTVKTNGTGLLLWIAMIGIIPLQVFIVWVYTHNKTNSVTTITNA